MSKLNQILIHVLQCKIISYGGAVRKTDPLFIIFFLILNLEKKVSYHYITFAIRTVILVMHKDSPLMGGLIQFNSY